MPASLIPSLLDMCPDIVIVEPWTGSDNEGTDTYGAPVNIPARVTGKMEQVIGMDGVEHVSRVHALLAGVFGVTVKDRFTLPVRFSTNPTITDPVEALKTRQPDALAITQATDENGPHHEKVYF